MSPRPLLALLLLAAVTSLADAAEQPVPLAAEPFPLDRVRLLEGPFKTRQELDARFLLEDVEPDRLLAGFRAQAGLPEKAKRYGGWEVRGINGHSLGHYLTALAALHAATGDERAARRIDYIVAELAACQEANGDGYVLPVAKSIYEDLRAGKIKASGFNLNGEWVPNYTLHKVLAGLRDAYRFAGNREALAVERRLADYLAGIYQNLSPAQAQEILKAEFGGLNEVYADLSTDTGDPRYLQLAQTVFSHDLILNPLKQGLDELDGKHGNTQIPKVVGLAREYLLTGDPADLKGVDTFWESVVRRRTFANGGHGDSEHFFAPEFFPKKLSARNAETCNTYNMIKLAGMKFSWEPRAADMDFVERGLLNHILANIGQKPGEFGYFLGLGDVSYKVWSTPHDSWWCCFGSGMENPVRYGEQVYFHHDDTLWVNLYLASRLDWRERGVVLRQETAFPESDTVRFVVETAKPTRFTLRLRHPYWCEKPEVTLNGKASSVASAPSSYLSLEREWRAGDVLTLRLPMALRLEPLGQSATPVASLDIGHSSLGIQPPLVALMYGPLQLAALVPAAPAKPDPARERYMNHLKARDLSDVAAPVLIADDTAALLAAIRPDPAAGFAAFRSVGVFKPDDLDLIPLHRVYEEHYAAYFPFYTPATWLVHQEEMRAAELARIAIAAATLDTVETGFQQSEVEHQFASDRTETADRKGRKQREVLPGGWFSYRMAVSPDKPVALVAVFWGGDRGREFELWIDDHRLLTARPKHADSGAFFEAAYAIPPELTRGKSSVTVRLVSPKHQVAFFGFRTVEASVITDEQWANGQR